MDLSHTQLPAYAVDHNHQIAPQQWLLEAERVAPLLVRRFQESALDGASWRSHVDTVLTYHHKHSKSQLGKQDPSSHAHVMDLLGKLKGAMRGELASISNGERVMNLRQAMQDLSLHFSAYQKVLVPSPRLLVALTESAGM